LILHPQFIKPRYDSTCFANLPQTVVSLLTGEGVSPLPLETPAGNFDRRYERVILIWLDALGWRFFERFYDRSPFFERLVREGNVMKLTSMFPSTTAAHATCIHTGLPPGQSGVHEWYYYEPQLDSLITPLFFSFAGDKARDTLVPTGITPEQLYPASSFYPTLIQQGVKVYIFQSREYAFSPYNRRVTAGAKNIPHVTLPEALVNLGAVLEQEKGPAYFMLYFDKIDTVCHSYGPNSPQLEAEIEACLSLLERLFLQKFQGKLDNTLLLLTADHGQMEVSPETTLYLNLDSRFAGLERYLKTNRQGQLLVPAGSSRDMFLYVKDELLEEAQALLAVGLEGKAEVYPVQSLIEAGFFGPVSPALLERVGNLVILPLAGESVWWYEKGRFEQRFYGQHGGLSREEMEIPLVVYDFS
jgi:predicted AlkP superfamily pyrophosphatase or phosphodiesterase